jgi:hypothetical protein
MPGSPVPTPFYGLGPAGGEPGQGEHGQGDAGVPGPPGADLVVIQPGLALSLLEALFAPPPGLDRDPGPVKFPRTVRPGPGADPLPGARRHGRDQHVGALLACGHGERVAAPDGHHIGHVLAFQLGLQALGLPVGLIGGEPGERHSRGDRLADHRLGLPRLGDKLHLLRDARRLGPVRVISPGPGQVELPDDQRVPVPGGWAARMLL